MYRCLPVISDADSSDRFGTTADGDAAVFDGLRTGALEAATTAGPAWTFSRSAGASRNVTVSVIDITGPALLLAIDTVVPRDPAPDSCTTTLRPIVCPGDGSRAAGCVWSSLQSKLTPNVQHQIHGPVILDPQQTRS
jgi:hypothetical protein